MDNTRRQCPSCSCVNLHTDKCISFDGEHLHTVATPDTLGQQDTRHLFLIFPSCPACKAEPCWLCTSCKRSKPIFGEDKFKKHRDKYHSTAREDSASIRKRKAVEDKDSDSDNNGVEEATPMELDTMDDRDPDVEYEDVDEESLPELLLHYDSDSDDEGYDEEVVTDLLSTTHRDLVKKLEMEDKNIDEPNEVEYAGLNHTLFGELLQKNNFSYKLAAKELISIASSQGTSLSKNISSIEDDSACMFLGLAAVSGSLKSSGRLLCLSYQS